MLLLNHLPNYHLYSQQTSCTNFSKVRKYWTFYLKYLSEKTTPTKGILLKKKQSFPLSADNMDTVMSGLFPEFKNTVEISSMRSVYLEAQRWVSLSLRFAESALALRLLLVFAIEYLYFLLLQEITQVFLDIKQLLGENFEKQNR